MTYAPPEVVNYLAMAFLQNGHLQLQYGGHKVTHVTVKLSAHRLIFGWFARVASHNNNLDER